ncbi:MAG TPA: DUF2309 domain-containing protein [Gammaproteobacteria bacterium]
MSHQKQSAGNVRELVYEAVRQLQALLPRQAPLRDFAHINTLEGLQHLPFPVALAEARRYRGISGYASSAFYREQLRLGRITQNDLAAVFAADESLRAGDSALETAERRISRGEVLALLFTHDMAPLSESQLAWAIEEQGALSRLQPGVSEAARAALLEGGDESAQVMALWSASLARLGLDYFNRHPEELAVAQTGGPLPDAATAASGHHPMREAAAQRLDEWLARVGHELTLRGLLREICGHDILEEYRPALVRLLANYLDQGMAPWHSTEARHGFYALWRRQARDDIAWRIEDLPEWGDELENLPDDPFEAVASELQRLGLPGARWSDYLVRLALELPGWSGMLLWHEQRPGVEPLEPRQVKMVDYLAVRLVVERIYARRLCRRLWRIEASLPMLRWYFRRRRSEFFVRHALRSGGIPEHFATLAQHLGESHAEGAGDYVRWEHLADRLWHWRELRGRAGEQRTPWGDAWRLFLLAQHLGLAPPVLRRLTAAELETLVELLALDEGRFGYLSLQAYERHYREEVFNALSVNHGRGHWQQRDVRPEAQAAFCMDEREEGIRRHLEELNPRIETLGAAGFFGLPIDWFGLDAEKGIPLCPLNVKPDHQLFETAAAGQEALKVQHDRRRKRRLFGKGLLLHEIRRNLLSSALLMIVGGPGMVLALLGRVLAPNKSARLIAALAVRFDKSVTTRVAVNASEQSQRGPLRSGFSDDEQVERVHALLRSMGLLSGFAPLVAIVGHGSTGQNNPHLAAYQCGACAGRYGGPNARAFAAIANRPEIRARLRERGVDIPADTLFLAAVHDTCSESLDWYDADQIPEGWRARFDALRCVLDAAATRSAHERARRFASAPDTARLMPEAARRHVETRALDFSQARAEYGHATNAVAFLGRRAMSRGLFLDRRAFLISYDPTRDPDGRVVEQLLLANAPVGAGINLDYYFSTVDNDGFGAGSKATLNVTAMLGVMHGTGEDLRPGLPRQSIEIHEPMRLLVVVEVTTELLTTIYQRQPLLQELVGNGWMLLAAKHPTSGAIYLFTPDKGWEAWHGTITPLQTVESSVQWYRSRRGNLPIALIAAPEVVHG